MCRTKNSTAGGGILNMYSFTFVNSLSLSSLTVLSFFFLFSSFFLSLCWYKLILTFYHFYKISAVLRKAHSACCTRLGRQHQLIQWLSHYLPNKKQEMATRYFKALFLAYTLFFSLFFPLFSLKRKKYSILTPRMLTQCTQRQLFITLYTHIHHTTSSTHHHTI